MRCRWISRARRPDHETQASTPSRSNPSRSAHPLLQLQHTAGNRAVGRFLQASLKVSAPGDAYEEDAERVADHVMRTAKAPGLCAECTRHEEDEEKTVQSKALPGRAPAAPPGLEARINGLRGSGQPLAETTRAFFEPRFGRDFSRVRVHTDTRAAEVAQATEARAFTVGDDIVFNLGEYSPESAAGKRVIAHELTHVIQQRRDHVQRLKVKPVGKHFPGGCGAETIGHWDFLLDKAAPCDGYIVQKNDVAGKKATCLQTPVTVSPAKPALTYWEAWPVAKGAHLFTQRPKFGFTDIVKLPGGSGSGNLTMTGEIKFFCKKVTGDLGDIGAAGADKDWGPGRAKQSGLLPSTLKAPGWWTHSPTEGPATRMATTWWNCCGYTKSQSSSAMFDP